MVPFQSDWKLRARFVDKHSRKWREYQIQVNDVKGATEKAIQLIDLHLPVVRVEIYCDNRFIKEVP